MKTSRRKFVTRVMRQVAGSGLLATGAVAARADPTATGVALPFFKLFPIGAVEKKGEGVHLRIYDEYLDGLLGLEEWSHLNVFYWFDKNDTPHQRRMLRVHPRGNQENPLTGVFACRAPVRPNLIALSVCRILAIQGNRITVDDLDAFDGTPLLDLKPFIPPDAPTKNVRVPVWARGNRPSSP